MLPIITEVDPEDREHNLTIFSHILSHMEPGTINTFQSIYFKLTKTVASNWRFFSYLRLDCAKAFELCWTLKNINLLLDIWKTLLDLSGMFRNLIQECHIRDLKQALKYYIFLYTLYPDVDSRVNYFDVYDERTGFLCFVLRYWLKLCSNQIDEFSKGHFLSAAILILGDLDPQEFQHISVRPAPRCLTLYGWLEVWISTHLSPTQCRQCRLHSPKFIPIEIGIPS